MHKLAILNLETLLLTTQDNCIFFTLYTILINHLSLKSLPIA